MRRSYHDLVEHLSSEVRQVTTAELAGRGDEAPLLIDIREPDEVRTGMIPGSYHVPRGVLEGMIWRIAPDPATEILLICSGGNRSVLSGASLREMGFTDVASLAGGTTQWRMEGRPIVVPGAAADAPSSMPLDTDAEARYARHFVLEGVGREGQRRLEEASVLIVGLGGLGSPVGLYLAAAGVGRLGLVDPDVVDVSNLQRQVIHDSSRIGVRKVASAESTIGRLNPGVEVVGHETAIRADNAIELMSGYDVVVDATDSFPARYLVNDAALHLRLPVVHGSVYRFEGQVSVFAPYDGPCYRCVFREPPPPELAPNCAEAGVLGVLPGTIGSIQATEVLKLIVDFGVPTIGRLLTYDAGDHALRSLQVARDPSCPACSDEQRPPRLVDYDWSCAPGGSVDRAAV